MNAEIRVPQVRLVDEEGRQIGIIATREALQLASERGIDLVEVAPQASPPVCRLMDYGKFRYEQTKRERMTHKRQKQSKMKSLRLRAATDPHDFETKRRQAERFLRQGHKVRFTLRFKGREITHQELGQERLQQMAQVLQEIAKVERPPLLEGRQLMMVVAPLPNLPLEELPEEEEWEEVDEDEEGEEDELD